MVKSKAYDKFLFEPTFPNPCFVDSTRDLGCLEKNLFKLGLNLLVQIL